MGMEMLDIYSLSLVIFVRFAHDVYSLTLVIFVRFAHDVYSLTLAFIKNVEG